MSSQTSEASKLTHKRSTLFYPNRATPASTTKAAKRESVQALGSIEHLQRLFAREGLAKASRPEVLGLSAKPALGGVTGTDATLAALEARSSVESSDIQTIRPPPQSTYKQRPHKWQDVSTTEAHHEALRPGVITALDDICSIWNLQARTCSSDWDEACSISSHGSSANDAHVDVVRLLSATASLVSSVRQYLIALPPDALIPNKSAVSALNYVPQSAAASTCISSSSNASRDAFKRQSSFLGLPRGAGSAAGMQAARSASMVRKPSVEEANSTSSSPLKQQRSAVAAEVTAEDPLVRVRKAALVVLGCLRALDERLRLSEDTTQSVSGSSNSSASEALLNTSLKSDDADSSRCNSFRTCYLYRCDVTLSDLLEEQRAVRNYVAIVDGVLASHAPLQRLSRAGSRNDAPPSPLKCSHAKGAVTEMAESPLNRTADLPVLLLNTGESEINTPQELEEHDLNFALPSWARNGPFRGGQLARAFALLAQHLPIALAEELPSLPSATSSQESIPAWRLELLSVLSDGQLLIVAYNATLRRSRRPWGFIKASMIHDLRSQPPSSASVNVNARSASESALFEGTLKSSQHSEHLTRPGWTFRRTENLRAWGAALRLRYGIGSGKADAVKSTRLPRRVVSESGPASTASTFAPPNIPKKSKQVDFDAPSIALKGPGWDISLEALLLKWVEAVVDEERS